MKNTLQFINNISSPVFLLKNNKIILFNNAFESIFKDTLTNKSFDEIFNVEKLKSKKSWIKKYNNLYFELNFSKFKSNNADYIIFMNEINEERKNYEEVNSTLTKFLSIISHDLRTPFIQIMSLAEIITYNYSDFSEEDLKKYMNLLDKSSKNGYNLLEILTEWGRIIKNKNVFEPIEFDASKIINNNISLIRDKADSKNISINLDNEKTSTLDTKKINCKIYADVNMFGTILQNLLLNAIKYSKKGGKITVKVENLEKNVQISVQDTGVGMHPKILGSLFKLDKTIKTSGTENETGTGLGLLLVTELIKKHKGKIWAESVLDVGSTIYFSLPKKS